MEEKLFLICGYGATGAEDVAIYALRESSVIKRFGMTHGRAPSFACRGTNGLIYIASEREDGSDITAYALEGGALRPVRTLQTPGTALCHLCAYGDVIYGSCYGSGDYFAVDADLTQVLWQFCPENAHAHWVTVVQQQAYLADLGNDCLYCWTLAGNLPTGNGVLLRQKEGSGPRQPLNTSVGLLCINELDGTLCLLDAQGVPMNEATASQQHEPRNYPGGACLDNNGLAWVCNRGPNTLSAWQVQDASLKPMGEYPTGTWPRMVAALPGTEVLAVACQREDEVRLYRRYGSALAELYRLPLPGAACILPL